FFFLETKHNPEPSSLLNFIAEYRKKWSDSIIHACKNLIYHEEFGSRTILVHSNSSAIHLLFRLAGDQGLHTKVIQTISGPGNEGKVQAEILSKLGFEVDLIHENAAGKFMREIDFAVFGADVIIEDYFINKAGTLQLSLLCNFYQKPVYVIADSRKLIHAAVLSEVLKKMILQEPVKPTEELWLNPPANVKPVNYWFESTPLDLITELVTEKGLLKPNKVSGMAKSTPISDLFHEELMK
ncbi:MAG: hypothetical protein FJY07_07070, partial [Bacteroidetes bacterium]|nr:hypothetical protein [Bacteroidota bacterium]